MHSQNICYHTYKLFSQMHGYEVYHTYEGYDACRSYKGGEGEREKMRQEVRRQDRLLDKHV